MCRNLLRLEENKLQYFKVETKIFYTKLFIIIILAEINVSILFIACKFLLPVKPQTYIAWFVVILCLLDFTSVCGVGSSCNMYMREQSEEICRLYMLKIFIRVCAPA